MPADAAPEQTGAFLVYATAESREQALALGRQVVEERLAACANVLAPMDSVYWWQGMVETATEAVLILKTRAELADALVARLRALHSYDTPAIVVLPILSGNPDYLDWIGAETRPT